MSLTAVCLIIDWLTTTKLEHSYRE